MTGNPLSRALFFWPGAFLIRLGQSILALSETNVGRYTVLPPFRVFCRFVLYARPYFVRGLRTNHVATSSDLFELIDRHALIAAIPCACRAGRTACSHPHHREHDLDVCLSFGFTAVVQIGSGLGKRLSPGQAKGICEEGAASGLAHHAIYSFGTLFEVCNCCAETCSVVKAYKAGVREAVRPSPFVAVRGPDCDGCKGRDSRNCEEVCPYGARPSSGDCLGCDLCGARCPRNAIVMSRRGQGRVRQGASAAHPTKVGGARRRRLPLVLAIVWMALIFATSNTVVRPQEFFRWVHENVFPDETAFERFQVFWGFSWFAIVKGWHAIEFALLLLLLVAALTRYTGRCTKRVVVTAMVFCVAFAVSNEWHQSFVPDRLGTVTDVLIDGLGVLAMGFLLLGRLHRRDRKAV